MLVDPPEPEAIRWSSFDALKPITKIILTNRDHVRGAELFRARYQARLVAGEAEISQLTPVLIDETVCEGDCIAGFLRVIDLPGKSPGEIGLSFDPAQHPVARAAGGIILLGDALIGHPRGALGLIPAEKVDDREQLKKSLLKLLDYDFEVLLLCDGQAVLSDGKKKVGEFLKTLG